MNAPSVATLEPELSFPNSYFNRAVRVSRVPSYLTLWIHPDSIPVKSAGQELLRLGV